MRYVVAVKADTDRGVWGAWARKERLARDWTVDEVVQRVATEARVRMDVATLRGIEGGSKKPSVRLQDALALVFGSRPQAASQPVSDANTAIIEALHEQTRLLAQLWPAVNELVTELRESRLEQQERAEAFGELLGEQTRALRILLDRVGTPAEREQLPSRAHRGDG